MSSDSQIETTALLMGGDFDSYFRLRMPNALKKRFKASRRVGGVEINQSDAIRGFIEMRCAFTEAKGRQPHSLEELCRWYLRHGKK